jgi:hypothetical protein
MIAFPEFVQQEIDGLWQGLVDSKVELKVDGLDRAFDRTDLLIVNALDVALVRRLFATRPGPSAWGR